MRAHHLLALLVAAVVIGVLAAGVGEVCQVSDRQYGGGRWGAETFSPRATMWTCWERFKP